MASYTVILTKWPQIASLRGKEIPSIRRDPIRSWTTSHNEYYTVALLNV